jgi:lambda family phage tail tape measure protein
MATNRSLGTLTLNLIAQIGGFTAPLDKASRDLDSHLTDMEKRAYDFGHAIGTAIKIAFAAFLGKEFIGRMSDVIQKMDELGKSAQKVGLPVEQFSALAAAAGLSNVQVDDLVSSLSKLAQSEGKAVNPLSQQAQVFKALGINVKDANGQLKSSTQVMDEFSDRFKELGTNSTTIAAGIALFGKNFEDLIPFLSQGSEGIKAAREEAIALGATLTGEAASAAAHFEDNLSKIKLAQDGIANQLAQALLPLLNEWTNSIVELAKDHSYLQSVANGVADTLHVLAAIAIEVAAGFKVIAATVQTLTVAIAADVDIYRKARDIYSHPFDITATKKNLGDILSISKSARGQIADIWSATSDGLDKSLEAAKAKLAKVGNSTAPIYTATKAVVDLSEAVDGIASKGAKGKDGLAKATQQIAALGAAAIKSGENVAAVQSVIGAAIDKLQKNAGNQKALAALQAALNPSATKQAEKQADALQALANAVAKINEAANPQQKAYNNYADAVRQLDQLGASAIKAGASVKQVQDLVAKGVTGAQKKLATDLDAPAKAAQAYADALNAQLDAQRAANDEAAKAIGLGSQQAANQAALTKVTQDGAQAVAKFTRQHAAQIAANDPQYTQELDALKQYWKDVYSVTVEGQQGILDAQSNWLNGIHGAYQDFLAEADNVAAQWRDITKGMLDSATDDFAAFLTGSKSASDAINDFISSAEAAITKFVAKKLLEKLMKSIFGEGSQGSSGSWGWVGEALGSIFSSGSGRANGGSVPSNTFRRVNERGPELLSVGGRDYLMMGSQSGRVTSHEKIGRSGATVNNNFYMAAPTSMKTQTQVANKAAYEIRRASRLS